MSAPSTLEGTRRQRPKKTWQIVALIAAVAGVLLVGLGVSQAKNLGLVDISKRLTKIISESLHPRRRITAEEVALREQNVLLNEAANRYVQQQRGEESLAAAEEAVKTATKLLTFDPNSPMYLHDLAVSYQRLGTAKEVFVGPNDALPAYLAYRDLSDQLNRRYPSADSLRSLAISHLKIGSVEWHSAGADQAMDHYVSGNELMGQLYQLEPTSINRGFLAQSFSELARVRMDANEPATALVAARKAWELLSAEAAEHPSTETTLSLAWSRQSIGIAILRIDGGSDALPHFTAARDSLAPFVQGPHPDQQFLYAYTVSLSRIGSALDRMGRPDDAVASFTECLKLFEKLHRSSPGYSLAINVADTHRFLAYLQLAQSRSTDDEAKASGLRADAMQHLQAVCDLMTPYTQSGSLGPADQKWLDESIQMIRELKE
jgi:tetratricopeptide (TPR) repeat protein